MIKKYLKFFENTKIVELEYYLLNERYHRYDGPVYIIYNKRGFLIFKEFWFKGKYFNVQTLKRFQKLVKLSNLD